MGDQAEDATNADAVPLRLRAFVAARYLLRITHHARQTYGLRFKECEVLFTVGCATMENVAQFMHVGDFGDDIPPPVEAIRPISRLSIADSTGLNRETVRRALAKLEQLGWVQLSPDGVSLVRTTLRQEHREFWSFAVRQFELAARDLGNLRSQVE